MSNAIGSGLPTWRMSFVLVAALAFAWLGVACGSSQGQPDADLSDTALSGTGGGGLGGVAGSGGTTGATGGKAGTVAVATGGVSGGGTAQGTGGGLAAGGSKASGGVSGKGGGQGTGGINATGGKAGTGGGSGAPSDGGGARDVAAGGAGGMATGGARDAAAGGGGGTATGGTKATGGSSGTGGGQGGSQTGIDGSATIPGGAPGNPDGRCVIPAEAQLEDVAQPTTVVGTGTAASCTGEAFVAAVAKGGVITFNCGADMATVRLSQPAKVFNDKGPKIVIDGGGKVTLSGEGMTRILYMNTCDEKQVWTSSHCDNQSTPELTVQNLTFANGNSKNETQYDGGGAIYASGGRFKVINSRFVDNVCADTGPDVGGGAIRAFQQYDGLPVYVVSSTFGGADGLGNVGSNGGALSSIGVSWTILNTVISYNHAVGNGGNPSDPGTPGGGSGGGIYNDGDTMTLTLCGTVMQYNQVNAYGSAIFFVSNDHSGNIVIDSSTITNNLGGSWYPTFPQISNHDDTPIAVTNSTIK